MKQLHEDLWQSAKYSSGILNTHAYFLRRPEGNVLFYNTGFDDDLQTIAELGGIEFQLLTHRDESGPSLQVIKARFGAKLGCSALEVPMIGQDAQVDLIFEPTVTQLGDIKIIHTPGHTDGSVCYFYKSPHGKSYLFTGDTFFQWNGEWSVFVMPSAGGSETALAESLQKLRDLEPDVVMSSGFVGEVAMVEPTRDEWIVAIDKQIASLTK